MAVNGDKVQKNSKSGSKRGQSAKKIKKWQ